MLGVINAHRQIAWALLVSGDQNATKLRDNPRAADNIDKFKVSISLQYSIQFSAQKNGFAQCNLEAFVGLHPVPRFFFSFHGLN